MLRRIELRHFLAVFVLIVSSFYCLSGFAASGLSSQDKFLAFITDPTVAYVLLMIGLYGLFLEFFTPGMTFPGVLGAIAVFLGGYGLHTLPIGFLGCALIVLGLAFLVTEVLIPTKGLLGLAGLVSFGFGSVFLVKPLDSGSAWPIHWLVIATVTVVTGLFFFFVLKFSLKAYHRRVVSGTRGMVGEVGVIESSEEWVWVMSERWRYQSTTTVKPGQRVRVLRVDGMLLHVEPVSDNEGSEK
jgi:membrane-bound serine protease (ClpP class)